MGEAESRAPDVPIVPIFPTVRGPFRAAAVECAKPRNGSVVA
jgi:hypothetical protein